jgi:uncharacterized protein YndB with AHSA1/START domain
VPEAQLPGGEPETAIEIRWIFEARREEVWKEWTEPERFADWYGADAEVPVETVEMDVRPGGKWRLVMHTPRGKIHWDGEYLEVEKPERLVFTLTDEPDADVYARCTVELTDLGDGRTEMRFEQTGGLPPAAFKAAREGWARFFRKVDSRLAGGSAIRR